MFAAFKVSIASMWLHVWPFACCFLGQDT